MFLHAFVSFNSLFCREQAELHRYQVPHLETGCSFDRQCTSHFFLCPSESLYFSVSKNDFHRMIFLFFWSSCLQNFLYLIWYTTMSIFGHFNNFFFAAHLLDIAMGFKTLRTILSSVTHNGKQVSVSTSRGRPSDGRKTNI